jgi:hypothetical protein
MREKQVALIFGGDPIVTTIEQHFIVGTHGMLSFDSYPMSGVAPLLPMRRAREGGDFALREQVVFLKVV